MLNIYSNKCYSFELSIQINFSQFPQKILSSTTVFNVDDKKEGFLSTTSAYYNDF